MCGFIAQLVEHRTGIAEVTGSNPVEALIFFFFQASSFQLLKLENLLQWSYFTFIYYRSSDMNYFIDTSHHFTHGKIWTQLIDLAPNVWLHSSVGRASHRYRGGHGFESRWSPDIFQASSFQLLKLENLLRWSFFTFNKQVYHQRVTDSYCASQKPVNTVIWFLQVNCARLIHNKVQDTQANLQTTHHITV